MESPLVSAIVLCYNHSRFVLDCLESVKAQQYPNLELIVNDDASRDDSVPVIAAWLAKQNIPHKFLRNETNRGICRSMNNALGQARGKYISGIAADDVWLPGKLINQVGMMERRSERVGVVYSDALQMSEDGSVLESKFIESDGRSAYFESMPEGDVQVAIWRNNFIPPMTTLIRRECFDRVGLFDESLFAEDWDMWLRISQSYEFAYSSELSAKYRILRTSATRANFGRLLDDMCRTCLKHLKAGHLQPGVRRAATERLHSLASSSFQQKSPAHKRNLWHALRYRPSAGIAGRLVYAWCGLKASQCEGIRTRLKQAAR